MTPRTKMARPEQIMEVFTHKTLSFDAVEGTKDGVPWLPVDETELIKPS